VIARQVIRRAAHGDALFEKGHLQLAEALFAAAIGLRHEGPHHDTACDRLGERLLQLRPVEPEDDDIDRLLGPLDRHQERRDSIVWLNDEFHGYFFTGFFSSQTTPTSAFGASSTIACETGSVALSSGTWTS
jgi:hypothetical protein